MNLHNKKIKYEGYWRQTPDEKSSYPWPVGNDEPFNGKDEFLKALSICQRAAKRSSYRGPSMCRICQKGNGSQEYNLQQRSHNIIWRWPDGFEHYVRDHNVQPSVEFRKFIITTKILLDNQVNDLKSKVKEHRTRGIALLPIENCIDCPYHLILFDPDPNDSFCNDDRKVLCQKSDNRIITVGCRPYMLRKECTVPSWCSLKKEKPISLEEPDAD